MLKNCIVWDNVGGAISGETEPTVTYSCIEGETPWPGPGNINADPMFCGWPQAEVWVDAQQVGQGVGTLANPYSDLRSALIGYRLSLQQGSPCIGSGEGGNDIGAATGKCNDAGAQHRLIHLGLGTYPIEVFTLARHVSIEGVEHQNTIVEGTIYGLQTNAHVSRITCNGIVVASHEAPCIQDCAITATAGVPGSGLVCTDQSTPILTNCTITENSAPGVSCWNGSPTLRKCVISNNLDSGISCNEASSPTLTNCTISGNSARAGGGVYCRGGSPNLVNCTITGNSAIDLWRWDHCGPFGAGGSIFCEEGSFPHLSNWTISGNWAWDGGGLYCNNASITLLNCIVWGNTPESVCGSLYHCLTEQDPLFVRTGEWRNCLTSDSGCLAYQWDQCVPTAWHRFVPGDYHLLPTSPCIDAGTCLGAPGFDIEGNARPAGKGCDIGAYEFGSTPARDFLRGDSNSDSKTNISDPVFNLNYQFALGPTPTCLKTADVNDDGLIDLADPIFQLNYLFVSGPTPPPPLSECGIDPTADTLSCEEYAPCR